MTTRYVLGADVGGTKTHVLIADEGGRIVGAGLAGPGNHETVGYDGLIAALNAATDAALASAGLRREQIAGAGFGVSGYDWPTEREATLAAIATLRLAAPLEAVNDTMIGLLAGAEEGWGLALVAGTGCNCRGRNRAHREGMVTGAGWLMGEGAGASELMQRTIWALSHAWSRRGPPTQLAPALCAYAGASDLEDLLEGLVNERYQLPAAAAPLVFEAARAGDEVARGLITWAGEELGELANAVARQLDITGEAFEIVLIGGMFNGGEILLDPLRRTVQRVAPRARLTRLHAPPVIGAVLLGMEQAGIAATPAIRRALEQPAQAAPLGV